MSWQTLATTNEADIEAWFRKWPDANIGIATGRESGIVVIDADDYKADGEQLARLEDRFGKLPETVTQTTGKLGRQFFFKHPAEVDVRDGANIGGEVGIDSRGGGGYAIVPPSVT